MEGVHLAFTEVRIDDAIEMVERCGSSSVYAGYVLGMIQICGGDYHIGWTTL